MDDYVTKPIRIEDLRAVLQKCPAAASLDPPPPVPTASKVAPAAAPASDGFDPAILAGLRKLQRPGQPDPAQRLVDLYLENLPQGLTAIREACAAGDSQALDAAAHKLKRPSGTLGANRVAELCGRLEGMGRAGTTDGAVEVAEELESAAQALLRRIVRKGRRLKRYATGACLATRIIGNGGRNAVGRNGISSAVPRTGRIQAGALGAQS
jgi:HPt (histidine-containing phosphotransfer) domain-containing protein